MLVVCSLKAFVIKSAANITLNVTNVHAASLKYEFIIMCGCNFILFSFALHHSSVVIYILCKYVGRKIQGDGSRKLKNNTVPTICLDAKSNLPISKRVFFKICQYYILFYLH